MNAPSHVTWQDLEDGVRLVVFDTGIDGPPFVITKEVLDGLERLLEDTARNRDIRALLLKSAQARVFCAGADVDAMAHLSSPQEAEHLIRHGQQVFARLADMPCPTVALINGTCVGGGLELALACGARTATPDSHTRLGLPETKLGILPAWGGTSRMPRLIGLEQSIALITGGKTLNAGRALKLGLVDSLVPTEHLLVEGIALADRLRQGTLSRKRPGGLRSALLERNPLGRYVLGGMARKAVLKATKGHYPAPVAALRVMLRGFPLRLEESLDLERREVMPLIEGQVHKNLLRLFRISRENRRPAIYATGKDAPAARQAVVIGGGVMGSGIAALLVAKGIAVRLVDPSPEALSRAWVAVNKEIDRRTRRRDLTRAEAAARLASFTVATRISGLGRADVIIEAATEQRELKEQILADMAAEASEHALLATNTSSYPIGELARSVGGPARFLGLHFFNPPLKMPLLEVVRGPETDDVAVARGLNLASAVGKTPVVVGDGPGFLVNRVLTPYFLDACRVAQEGTSIEEIDTALYRFGMPMGPFRLMDEVGLDVMLHAGTHISQRENSSVAVHPFIEGLVEKGCLGRKSGEGFFRYGGKKRSPGVTFSRMVREYARSGDASSRSASAIADRLIGRMVAEARKTIGEGLVLANEDVDIATIFGIGFPPWRGGLIHYSDSALKDTSEEEVLEP